MNGSTRALGAAEGSVRVGAAEGKPGGDDRVSVRIWVVPLDVHGDVLTSVAEWLDASEVVRAGRYHFEHHRRRFIARRAARRLILGGMLGTSPGEVPFREVGSGKPEVISGGGSGLHFSASHSEEWAVVAVSQEVPIGVDIEMYRLVEGSLWEVRHLFSDGEREVLEHVSERERARMFFDCWTRKEACVKADGAGLEIALDSFEVPLGSLGDGVTVRIPGGHGEGDVTLISVPVRENAAISLAVQGAGRVVVEARAWDWGEATRCGVGRVRP